MKTLFTIAILFVSTAVFAGNNTASNTTDKQKAEVLATLNNLIGDTDVINALGINGQADITITVDNNGIVHIDEVQSNDFMLEYHIRHSVEGVKMMVEDSLVGKTFSFFMNVVQSK